MKSIVVLPDIQFPFHNPRQVASVIRFIGEYQPDEVVQIGDLMDYPQTGRWTKDTRAEFEGSVLKDSKKAVEQMLAPLREEYAGPVTVLEGNHDLRPRTYLEKYAPALAETNVFDLDVLLEFEDYDINFVRDWYDFAPKWTFTHGHLGGVGISRYAGGTAMNLARKFQRSIICGHTHRQGVISETRGRPGQTTTISGVEVGHMMQPKAASYLKGAAGNWQAGFTVVHVDGKNVTTQLVPMNGNGFFNFQGEQYK